MTAETTTEDIDMAAAYLAPIVWSGIEWHQCTSSMKDAVRDHVRGLRGVGHARPIDWEAVERWLTKPEVAAAVMERLDDDAPGPTPEDCWGHLARAAVAAAKAKGADR